MNEEIDKKDKIRKCVYIHKNVYKCLLVKRLAGKS